MANVFDTGDRASYRERWPVKFRNNSGETIPPYACLEVYGAVGVPTGQELVLLVRKPSLSGSAYIFNGPIGVKSGKHGRGKATSPWVAAVSGSPVFGTGLGPVAGAWTVSTAGSGLKALGASEDGVVLVMPTGTSDDRYVATSGSDGGPGDLSQKLYPPGTYNALTDRYVEWQEINDGLGNYAYTGFVNIEGLGGGEFAAGYCITFEDIGEGVTAIHHDAITDLAGEVAADRDLTKFQLWHHLPDALFKDDAKWIDFDDYDGGEDQMWWHRSGSFTFMTTANYSTTAGVKQSVVNEAGTWVWRNAHQIKCTVDDSTESFLHDAIKDAATFVANEDGVVAAATDGAAATNQTERFFLDCSAISGFGSIPDGDTWRLSMSRSGSTYTLKWDEVSSGGSAGASVLKATNTIPARSGGTPGSSTDFTVIDGPTPPGSILNYSTVAIADDSYMVVVYNGSNWIISAAFC